MTESAAPKTLSRADIVIGLVSKARLLDKISQHPALAVSAPVYEQLSEDLLWLARLLDRVTEEPKTAARTFYDISLDQFDRRIAGPLLHAKRIDDSMNHVLFEPNHPLHDYLKTLFIESHDREALANFLTERRYLGTSNMTAEEASRTVNTHLKRLIPVTLDDLLMELVRDKPGYTSAWLDTALQTHTQPDDTPRKPSPAITDALSVIPPGRTRYIN